MKIKVLENFIDIHTFAIHPVGEVIDLAEDEARAKDIIKRGLGEEVKTPKPRKATKKKKEE